MSAFAGLDSVKKEEIVNLLPGTLGETIHKISLDFFHHFI